MSDDEVDETDPLESILTKYGNNHYRLLKEQDKLGKQKRSKCTPIHTSTVLHPKVTRRTQVEDGVSKDGFQLKKRSKIPVQQRNTLLDFIIENPYDGKLKNIDCIEHLVQDYPNSVFKAPTSYCHYGYPYQKRTIFISTLSSFRPTPPCPITACPMKKSGRTHSQLVSLCPSAQKNSIPTSLVDQLVTAWMDDVQGIATGFLLVDVFSGWGSVSEHVRSTYPQIKVYSNDIVNRPHVDMNMDMTTFSIGSLLIMASGKFWGSEEDTNRRFNHPHGILGWFRDERIAILVHISTPCETYSTNGLAKHRISGTVVPKTQQAVTADAMNAELVCYLRRNVLE